MYVCACLFLNLFLIYMLTLHPDRSLLPPFLSVPLLSPFSPYFLVLGKGVLTPVTHSSRSSPVRNLASSTTKIYISARELSLFHRAYFGKWWRRWVRNGRMNSQTQAESISLGRFTVQALVTGYVSPPGHTAGTPHHTAHLDDLAWLDVRREKAGTPLGILRPVGGNAPGTMSSVSPLQA